MGLRVWLRIAAALVGALALIALVWWAGPLVAVGEVRPLGLAWVRLVVCAVILLAVAGWTGYDVWRRIKAERALEASIGEAEESHDDSVVLAETMRDALATLRQARGMKGDSLYELPWYILIGPPGSGKTTALVNSGLKFPLAQGATPAAVAGIGGTRYCDWWFTEDAVLIDTAGRYTTQDSDPKGDRASWLAFLDLLGKNRPKQPINGVLIAISLEDVLTAGEEELAAHATAIRKRLLELHERLKVDFPVYALFTKADLLAGFTEFFGNLSEPDRRMVWGHTFQTADKTKNMVGEVPAEFDALVTRLNEWVPDRLQDEPNPTARVVLYGFPSQMAAAKTHVASFLGRIFEPSRYHVNATLRGFYFTSGTQQGTPIDQLIGALSRSFGSEDVAAASYSGRGRSYFLTDLLKKVVIGEAGWVSTNRTAVRRANALRIATYAGLALVSATLAGLWWSSYLRNSQLIGQDNTLLAKYRADASEILREPVVADANLPKVLPYLTMLRTMPAGYATRDEATPILATFGLDQRPRLRSAAETAYHVGLERMFRSRLIFRLEEQLETNRNNPSFVYEALKVYLMLGRRPEARFDRDLILAWMRRDWETLFPGAGPVARARQQLEEHLLAMLDLEEGSPPLITVNGSLVEDSQRTLARLNLAERTYELLKSQARPATARDWTAKRAGGPDSALVFDAVGGGDLETVRVPFFFTYDGFYEAFVDRFGDVAEIADQDRWVLGTFGQQQAYTAQYKSLWGDLLKLYARDFVPAWTSALGRLKLRPMAADKPRYEALQALSAPTSPLKQILESLRDETRLTREQPAGKSGSGQPAGGGTDPRVGKAQAVAKDLAIREAESRAGSFVPGNVAATASALGRIATEGGGSRPAAGANPSDRFVTTPNEAPGANIEASFRQYHNLLEGEPRSRTVDNLIVALNDLKNSALEATNPTKAAEANVQLVTNTRVLRSLASRFPAPFEPMIRQVANEFEGNATDGAIQQLRQALADQVTRDCQQIVPNRYPFQRTSEREVPVADFARLFAPAGILDRFFAQYLASRVDRSRPQWAWRQDDGIARGLSPATLREFQRANDIRESFFPTGGNMPSFNVAVTPLTLTGDASRAKFDVNGTVVTTQQGVNTPVSVQWPGPSGLGRTTITIEQNTGLFGAQGTPLFVEKNGSWSLFRMLDTGSVLRQGDALVATFPVQGREIAYRLNVGAIQNPLTLPALREFKCPAGI